MKIHLNLFVFPLISCLYVNISDKYTGFDDHALVIENDIYPYTAAILKKGQYISAGALIHENWVLTAADALFLLQDIIRLIQVRIGTTNYKEGGILLPCKFFEIHPMFDDRKPQYDIALIRLPDPVNISPSRKPIKLEKKRKLKISHFTVTAWSSFNANFPLTSNKIESIDAIKKRRILTVSHLHPSEQFDCVDMLGSYRANGTDTIMCLEPADDNDTNCHREIGAPVVYNGVLRGIISSWRPENCRPSNNLIVVNVVTSPTIRTWIHAVVHDKNWEEEFEDDSESNCPISDYMGDETSDYEDTYSSLDSE